MKRPKKGRKRSSGDSNEEDIAKHELVVGLEEISATQKYIPVFGKSVQPKQKAAKTDSIQEEGLYDQTTKSIISSLEVNEHGTDAIEIKMMTNDGQVEKTDSSSNDDKALCQDSHIVDIERKDCLNIFNSNEGCVAQTVEECSKIGITNSSDNDDTGNQKQKDEYQKDENKVLDSAVKADMQEDLAFSQKVTITQDRLVTKTTCEDYSRAQYSRDDAVCDTERTEALTVAFSIINKDNLNNSKDSNSVRDSNEIDCSKVQDTKVVDHDDDQATSLEATSSKKSELDYRVNESGEGNTFIKEQVCVTEEVIRKTAENVCDKGNRNKVNGHQAVQMSTAKDETVILVFSDSRDQMNDNNGQIKDSKDRMRDSDDQMKDSKYQMKDSKDQMKDSKDQMKDSKDQMKDRRDQRKESRNNEGKITGLQDKTSKLCSSIGEEDKVRNKSEMNDHLSKPTNPKPDSLDIDWERTIDEKMNAPKMDMSLLFQKEEGLVTVDLSQRNICKGGTTNTTDIHPFLEYEEDAMMTDSQINLLDEDMLILPQCSGQECHVPDTTETEYGKSRKTVGDYIADGEHLMKGIIEEISSITKTIVNMKRFIDSVKKQRQTRINTIWKSNKTK